MSDKHDREYRILSLAEIVKCESYMHDFYVIDTLAVGFKVCMDTLSQMLEQAMELDDFEDAKKEYDSIVNELIKAFEKIKKDSTEAFEKEKAKRQVGLN